MFWRRLKKSPAGLIGGGLVLFWFLVAVVAPAPYSHTAMSIEHNLAAPNWAHWLGTDQMGRDILSRIVIGSRSIISIGLSVALISTGLGTLIGFLAAYYGGRLEELIMRFMDILMSIPVVVLAMVFLGIVPKAGWGSLIIVISLVFVPRTSRVARGGRCWSGKPLNLWTRPRFAANRACTPSSGKFCPTLWGRFWWRPQPAFLTAS